MIGILGGSGFIGGNLVQDLGCLSITRENYQDHIGSNFNILINANGNSSKLLPEKDPVKDFDLTVRNTFQSVLDFKFDKYVYLSSCEVYEDLSSKEKTREEMILNPSKMSRYGLSKFLAEQIVRKYCPKWLILRIHGPVGKGMKKGPIFDIMQGEKLWISGESELQFFHVSILPSLMHLENQIVNVTGKKAINLLDVMEKFGKVPYPDLPLVKHNISVEKVDTQWEFNI